MNMKFTKVVMAINDCEGIEIPYPLAKKMAEVSKELRELLELNKYPCRMQEEGGEDENSD